MPYLPQLGRVGGWSWFSYDQIVHDVCLQQLGVTVPPGQNMQLKNLATSSFGFTIPSATYFFITGVSQAAADTAT